MGDTEQVIGNSSIGALLAYLERCHGAGAVDRVLQLAGDRRPLSELRDPTFWSTADQVEALFAAARDVTGDDQVARRAGAELLTHYASSEVVGLLRSLDSLADAFAFIAEAASKATTALRFSCEEVGDRHALVAARQVDAHRPFDARVCLYSEGAFEAMPTLYGFPAAEVVQLSCLARGDELCLFRVTWDPEGAADPAVQARFWRDQVDALTRRFEALEEMASDLARVGDVDQLLERIIHRAGVAVRAPRYLLAVTLPGDRRPRVHHVGFAGPDARRAAAEILDGGSGGDDLSRLVVDVAAGDTWFGRLGAFFPLGHRFLPAERRLLAAYAGHAAAALQTTAALADRQHQADTNLALLQLAATLAGVTDAGEVARRLADAVPDVTGCARCAVLVWEPADGHLVLSAPAHPAGRGATRVPLAPSRRRQIAQTAAPGLPLDQAPEVVAAVPGASRRVPGLAVPLAAAGELQAVAALLWDDPAGPREADAAVVAGVAGLAATAFHNARLLQRVAHQASHDPLTGLANLRLFRELASTALANARRQGDMVGLLFVDLDGFKGVNDDHGHATGDAVLAAAAERIRVAVRTGDTPARLGGDEFVVLLPRVRDTAEAEAVAHRIIEQLGRPVPSPSGPLALSASIGIACSPGTADVDALLAGADGAMYRAKAAGGGRWAEPPAPG